MQQGAERYAELLKISSSLAFGSMSFMLAFERDMTKAHEEYRWLIYCAWFCFAVSSVAGALCLWEWAAKPYNRIERAKELFRLQGRVEEVPSETTRTEETAFRFHLGGFSLGFLLLCVFRGLTF
jgi:hypothetical protein